MAPNRTLHILVGIFVPIATLALIGRFIARRKTKLKIAADDILAFVAWSFFIITTSLQLWGKWPCPP
jgi:hypothetical protein